jgi:choline dehydrogenase
MFMRFERMHRSKSFEVPTVMKNGIGIIRLLGEEQKNSGSQNRLS